MFGDPATVVTLEHLWYAFTVDHLNHYFPLFRVAEYGSSLL